MVDVPPEVEVCETASLDFKASFDPSSAQDVCELIKDLVSMANSGGGHVVVGISDDGSAAGTDVKPILDMDVAVIVDKIYKYSGRQFSDIHVRSGHRSGSQVAVVTVGPAGVPIVFTNPGTYPVPGGGGKQNTVFGRGTVYFRHGPKSEPGNSEDLRLAVEREVDRVRHSWLDGITKVVTAPTGSTVSVVPQDVQLVDSPRAMPIRLTADEGAPAFKAPETDDLWPYRQKELIVKVNSLVGAGIATTHDILCIRRAHNIDDNLTFSYQAQWSPRKYSDAFAEWIAEQYRSDSQFFQKARSAYKQHA